MQHNHIQKKNVWPFDPTPWVKGVYGQNKCLHGALRSIPLNLICNKTTSKKKCFDFLIPPQWPRVCVKTEYVLAWRSMLYSFYFDMQHDYFQKKNVLTFWPHPWGQGCIHEQNTWYHVAAYIIPFNLICMQHDHFLKKFNFGIRPTSKST